MKKFTVTQQYMICTVNEKGLFPGHDRKAVVCLIMSGILEMQLANCVFIEGKKLSVSGPLPEQMEYLRPLYQEMDRGKPIKIQKIVEAYLVTFTSKKLQALVEAVLSRLEEEKAVIPVKAGILGKQQGYIPEKEAVEDVISGIRAGLLEDEAPSEDVAAVAMLLDETGSLKKYVTRQEQKELKARIKQIRSGEVGKTVREMVQYFDALAACVLTSIISASNS